MGGNPMNLENELTLPMPAAKVATKKTTILQQLIKFALVGVSNTAIDIAIFVLLVWMYPTNSNLGLLVYNTIAVFVAALNSFIWNKLWTFHKTHTLNLAVEIWRFLAITALIITINNASLFFLTTVLPHWVITNTLYLSGVKGGAIALTWTISFVGMRLWVFVDGRTEEEYIPDLPLLPAYPYPYSLSVVLPAYNEAENITATINDALSVLPYVVQDFEIIVVNDGSKDATAAIVQSMSIMNPHIRLVNHSVNQGAGAALISGFMAASKRYTMYMDSDGQFSLRQGLPGFLPHIGDVDGIFGYRIHRQDRFMRKVNAWGWRNLVYLVFGVKIRDLDCGFKLFRTSFLQAQKFDARGAMLLSEIVYRFMRAGFTYREIGVKHYNRKFGSATGAKISVILKAFKELVIMANKWSKEDPR